MSTAPHPSAPSEVAPRQRRRGVPRITVEPVISGPDIQHFYGLYLDAFGPLRTRAAARHVLHEEEFLEEMVNPLVDKYVAWDADGHAVALATLTQHLETVPWISPEFFAHHFPEATERGVVFYLGFVLADPGRQRQRLFTELTEAVIRRVTEVRGVCGWDVCAFNTETVGFSDVVVAVSQGISPVEVEVLDSQTYFCGIPDVSRSLVKLPRMRGTGA